MREEKDANTSYLLTSNETDGTRVQMPTSSMIRIVIVEMTGIIQEKT